MHNKKYDKNDNTLMLNTNETIECWKVVKRFITKHKLNTNGCKTFYTPLEWKYRKEECCQDAVLNLVYDGSEVKEIVFGRLQQKFKDYLAEHGYYLEEGLHWYCGIYKK
jgi:hypothetical protein